MGTIQRQIYMTSQVLGPIIQTTGCFTPSNCFRYQRGSCANSEQWILTVTKNVLKRGLKTFDFKEAVYVNMYIFDENSLTTCR